MVTKAFQNWIFAGFEFLVMNIRHGTAYFPKINDNQNLWRCWPYNYPCNTRKKGRYKRTKGGNLLEHVISEQDAVPAFAFNKKVPFTNNLAERDIRPVMVKQLKTQLSYSI